ncbi:MAG: hydantoinase/oxoprolinase family protein [Gammaproteobacteria bacterium]|nr:hydantoinase/oxoprolinase family protein [Gammaproteobacteria bacterium]
MNLLGIDTGGTFTDFVLLTANDLKIHKVLSTPQAPEQAILQGIDDLGLRGQALLIVHGSTVATNAVLEGKGVRTAYITNHGMGDILSLGRQTRKQLYNLQPKPCAPPVPQMLCLETAGRITAKGVCIEPLQEHDLRQLKQQLLNLKPQAVAINLLFSFLNDTTEKQIQAIVPQGIFVSRASAVLPEIKEYERGMTTWLNAAVGPLVKGYLQCLVKNIKETRQNKGQPRIKISIMQSSGGSMNAQQAADKAVHMLLSGPAGGLAGAKFIATTANKERLLTFDMGGTSTDVAMIDGDLQLTNEGYIGHYPVAVPMVDMHTIGAGGGSIAVIDEGGLLQVGPKSSGAVPGPACYGRGGQHATVTDANLVLGRLRADTFLASTMTLCTKTAKQAIAPLAKQLSLGIEAVAQGIIHVANEHMARALRIMSVQRGIDPTELTLVSFGGAGGLHVCALAGALNMRQAMVPIHAGVLSALGMLVAPRARHLSLSMIRSLQDIDETQLQAAYGSLQEQGRQALLTEGLQDDEINYVLSADVRYLGQSYTINVPWQGAEKTSSTFNITHKKRYGHALQQAVELVTIRLKAYGESTILTRLNKQLLPKTRHQNIICRETHLHGIDMPASILDRHQLPEGYQIQGPALITEALSTTYIEPGWLCRVDQRCNLILQRL